MKELNNRCYDDNHNSWDMDKYTKEEAELASRSLVNCHYCIDCHDCIDCRYCNDCHYCHYCHHCHNCHNCHNCNDCHDCIDCRYCRYSNSCRDCIDCRSCFNFLSDPRKFTSKNIGSRNDKTYFYWTDEKDQIVCGCFNGTLSEFEERVKEVHGDNEYGKEYQEFIQQCKMLKGI